VQGPPLPVVLGILMEYNQFARPLRSYIRRNVRPDDEADASSGTLNRSDIPTQSGLEISIVPSTQPKWVFPVQQADYQVCVTAGYGPGFNHRER
jgi:hypothetical protein